MTDQTDVVERLRKMRALAMAAPAGAHDESAEYYEYQEALLENDEVLFDEITALRERVRELENVPAASDFMLWLADKYGNLHPGVIAYVQFCRERARQAYEKETVTSPAPKTARASSTGA